MLRTTIAAFAAAVGGADSLLVVPHTAALQLPDGDARALARNLQHLLMEEAHLHRVMDPSAGSGAIEALTEALAEKAWTEFQKIESEGGIARSLGSGAFTSRIAKARDALAANSAPATRRSSGQPSTAQRPKRPPQPDAPAAKSPASGLAPVRLEELAAA